MVFPAAFALVTKDTDKHAERTIAMANLVN
jgi:hypothetical protein